MSTPDRPAPSPPRPKKARARQTLEDLATLRSQVRKVGKTLAVTPLRPAAAAQKSAEDGEDGDFVQTFRRAVRDAVPIKNSGRAEINPPRPAPLPRPRQEDLAPDTTVAKKASLDTLDDDAYFRVMMEDVLPQKDAGRMELGFHQRRNLMPSEQKNHHADAGASLLAGWLPPDSRPITPEELFRHATRGIQPLGKHNRIEPHVFQPDPEPIKRHEDEHSVLHESLHTPLTLEDRLDSGTETTFIRTGLARRVLIDLRRGRWALQGEIDLHGLNRDEARQTLGLFLANCLQRGQRCIRVIHGKGLGSPGKYSILKQLSHGWLAQREEILAFCQAGPYQGGSGALLVLLRSPNAGRLQNAAATRQTGI